MSPGGQLPARYVIQNSSYVVLPFVLRLSVHDALLFGEGLLESVKLLSTLLARRAAFKKRFDVRPPVADRVMAQAKLLDRQA